MHGACVMKRHDAPGNQGRDPATLPTHVLSQAELLTRTIASLHARGWCDGTGGNFSCVVQRAPLILLMAPSGVDKGEVEAGMLIQVNGAGEVVSGQGRASAETLLHLAIIQTTGAGAVLHTHSQSATLLSQAPVGWLQTSADMPRQAGEATRYLPLRDLEMLKGLRGVSTHATTVALPVLANDQNLERLSARARPLLRDAPFGLLIAGHGLYAWGDNLQEAKRHLESLEFLLEQRWRRLLLEALWGPSELPEGPA